MMCSHAFHKKSSIWNCEKVHVVILHQLVIFNQETIGTEMYFHYWGLDRSTNLAPKYNLILFKEVFHAREHGK